MPCMGGDAQQCNDWFGPQVTLLLLNNTTKAQAVVFQSISQDKITFETFCKETPTINEYLAENLTINATGKKGVKTVK